MRNNFMRAVSLSLVYVLALDCIYAQQNGTLTFGIHVGTNYTTLSDLKQTFCSEENLPTYELSDKAYVTPAVSITAQYRFPISLVAIEGVISYCQTHSKLTKVASRNKEMYDIKLNHILLGVGAKVYPVKGYYAKVGIAAGPCINSTSCVKYNATGATNTVKMQISEHISQSVKGRTLVRADLSLGYDFQTGLTVEAFYGRGLTDLLEVGVNSYNITEHRNDSQYIGVCVGWLLSKSGFTKRH